MKFSSKQLIQEVRLIKTSSFECEHFIKAASALFCSRQDNFILYLSLTRSNWACTCT